MQKQPTLNHPHQSTVISALTIIELLSRQLTLLKFFKIRLRRSKLDFEVFQMANYCHSMSPHVTSCHLMSLHVTGCYLVLTDVT